MQATNQTHCLLKSATIAIMDLVIQNTCTRMKNKKCSYHILKSATMFKNMANQKNIFSRTSISIYIGNKYTTYQQQAPPRQPDNEIVNAPSLLANSGFMFQ